MPSQLWIIRRGEAPGWSLWRSGVPNGEVAGYSYSILRLWVFWATNAKFV